MFWVILLISCFAIMYWGAAAAVFLLAGQITNALTSIAIVVIGVLFLRIAMRKLGMLSERRPS